MYYYQFPVVSINVCASGLEEPICVIRFATAAPLIEVSHGA